MKYLTFLAILMLLLKCDNNTSVAGAGGSSETQNGLTGLAKKPDGTPAANAFVQLRQANYVSTDSGCQKSNHFYQTMTDNQGKFGLDSVIPGSYRLEITDKKSIAVLIEYTTGSHDSIMNLGSQTLKPFVTVQGQVAPSDLKDSLPLFVQVVGMERYVPVAKDGSFAMQDLPEGTYSLIIVKKGEKSPSFVMRGIEVASGDTVQTSNLPGWTHSATVNINTTGTGAGISELVTQFPLLIRLDSNNFDFNFANPNGSDLRFAKKDGTPLPYEIDSWESSLKTASIWVLVDSIYANRKEANFSLNWGNSTAKKLYSGKDVFGSDSNFLAVFHMQESPSLDSGAIKNAIENELNGTNKDSSTINTKGIIGKALEFNPPGGNGGGITLKQLHQKTDRAFTWSAWFKATKPQNQAAIIGETGPHARLSWGATEKGMDQLKGVIVNNADTTYTIHTSVAQKVQTLNEWHHAVATASVDTKILSLYLDGMLVKEISWSGKEMDLPFITERLKIGGGYVPGNSFIGSIDEARIEKKARSYTWIKLAYENQKENGNLVVNIK